MRHRFNRVVLCYSNVEETSVIPSEHVDSDTVRNYTEEALHQSSPRHLAKLKFKEVDPKNAQEDVLEILRRRLRAIDFELQLVSKEEYQQLTKQYDEAGGRDDADFRLSLPLISEEAADDSKVSGKYLWLESLPASLLEHLGIRLAGVRPNILPAKLKGLPKTVNPEGTGEEILLQGFNWDSCWQGNWYEVVSSQADLIADAGFTAVWLPPPTDSVSPQGYMPRDLYNLNSSYGSQEVLISAIRQLQSRGLKVLGDAVLNHRCAHHRGEDGVYNIFGGRLAWDARAVVGDDPNFRGRGNRSSGDAFPAAPNIDHSQDFVKQDLSEWLIWLRTHAGFDGWRLDFVKGFHGGHVKAYMEASRPQFVVGEYWDALSYDMDGCPTFNQDAHRQRTIEWIKAAGGKSTAFDITTKGILHAVFERCEYWRLRDSSGKPPGLIGWWPSRSVTFIENHDTGSSQGHWRFPSHALEEGYAYILTHPGTPCVFYDHLFYDHHLGSAIRRLIDLRRRSGLHCRSEVTILEASHDIYAAMIDQKIIVKIGPGDWSPIESNWKIADCGHCWATWQLQTTESNSKI